MAEEYGYFNGSVITEWLKDREMKLLNSFSFIDPYGYEWEAPAGSIINGASIPRPLWSLLGGPFEGPYRLASVPHDVACQNKTHESAAVHTMFYHACRAGGMSEAWADLFYWALMCFGPRWDLLSQPTTCNPTALIMRRVAMLPYDERRKALAYEQEDYNLQGDASPMEQSRPQDQGTDQSTCQGK